jgi:hypothetical protein
LIVVAALFGWVTPASWARLTLRVTSSCDLRTGLCTPLETTEYVAAPGEANRITVHGEGRDVIVHDDGAQIAADAGRRMLDQATAACLRNSSVLLLSGDADDGGRRCGPRRQGAPGRRPEAARAPAGRRGRRAGAAGGGGGSAEDGVVLQQQVHRPVVTGGRRHGEQVVAVGALLPRDLGPALEHLTQAVGIVRLDGTVGAEERLTAARQPPDVAPQRRPAREAVRPRDDQSRTIRGERGPDAPKRRDGARRCVLGGCARPVGALCV